MNPDGNVGAARDTPTVVTPALHFLGHSTVRIELAGRTVLTDPVLARRIGAAPPRGADPRSGHLGGRRRRPDQPPARRPPAPALAPAVGSHVHVVVPRGAGAWLRRRGFPHVSELGAGETLHDGDLRITGIRAEHSGHRYGPRSTHGPDTDAVGHLLEGGGSTVYISGDTSLHSSMPTLGRRDVDVARAPRLGLGPESRPRAPRPDRSRRGRRPDPPAPRRPGALGHAHRRRLRSPFATGGADAPAAGRAAAAVRRRGGRPRPGDDGARDRARCTGGTGAWPPSPSAGRRSHERPGPRSGGRRVGGRLLGPVRRGPARLDHPGGADRRDRRRGRRVRDDRRLARAAPRPRRRHRGRVDRRPGHLRGVPLRRARRGALGGPGPARRPDRRGARAVRSARLADHRHRATAARRPHPGAARRGRAGLPVAPAAAGIDAGLPAVGGGVRPARRGQRRHLRLTDGGRPGGNAPRARRRRGGEPDQRTASSLGRTGRSRRPARRHDRRHRTWPRTPCRGWRPGSAHRPHHRPRRPHLGGLHRGARRHERLEHGLPAARPGGRRR